jgi:hypothetical protein
MLEAMEMWGRWRRGWEVEVEVEVEVRVFTVISLIDSPIEHPELR